MPITVPTILTGKHRLVTLRLCTRYSVSAYLALTVTATTMRGDPFARRAALSQITRVNVSARARARDLTCGVHMDRNVLVCT